MIDSSQISKGYLLERSTGPRRLLSGRKISLSEICWVYVEKTPHSTGWVDLDLHHFYTMKFHLRDGRVVTENIDGRKTNVNERYEDLKKAAPWAVFGYQQKYANAWEYSRKKFVSDVIKRRTDSGKREGQPQKKAPAQEPGKKRVEIKKSVEKDYFKILGVPKTVKVEELNARFRELARAHHPDMNSDPDAEIKFKELSEAYSIVLQSAKEWVTSG